MIGLILLFLSGCQRSHLIEHIFHEDAVAGGWVVDQHVSDGTDELAVLDDR